MIYIFIKKIGMLLLSTTVLLCLAFWFYVRVNNIQIDEDFIKQFSLYIMKIVNNDFGISSQSRNHVFNDFVPCFIASAELVFVATVISCLLGFYLGCHAALHKERFIDKMITNVSIFFSAIPVFWIAQILISVIAVYFEYIPSQGRISSLYDIPTVTGFILYDTYLYGLKNNFDPFINACLHFILPTIAIAILPITEIIRITRNSIHKILQKNYVKLSFTRGYSPTYVIRHHVMDNALPMIYKQLSTVVFMTFTSIIIVENAFNWPGVGTLILEALKNNDYNMIHLYLLVVGFLLVSITTFIDLMYDIAVFYQQGGKKING